MLGAYQPSPNAITLVIQALDSLTAAVYPVIALGPKRTSGNFSVALMREQHDWMKKNLQPMMDFLVEDYNRKYPFRRMRRIMTSAVIKNMDYFGGYNPVEHSIDFFLPKYFPSNAQAYNLSGGFSTDPILFTAKAAAVNIVGFILHEFLHATQSYIHSVEEPTIRSALTEDFRYIGATYRVKKAELASYAMNTALWSAVFTPRRIYRDHDLRRIIAFNLLTNANMKISFDDDETLLVASLGLDLDTLEENSLAPEMIQSIERSEDEILTTIYLNSIRDKSLITRARPGVKGRLGPREFLLKNRGAALVRDEFKRIREGRVPRIEFEKFKKGMKEYIDLQIRNVRRRIINFDPVNQHYGLVNQTLYKPDYYGLKL
jgi:hypothetical protein